MTQCEKVIAYIQEHGSITQRDAYKLGIYRLASRAYDLTKQGYPIRSATETVTNKDGTHSNIARYTMGEIK